MSRIHYCLMWIACLWGCGPGDQRPPAPSDPAKAHEALVRTLDAWKSGGRPESLRDVKPSIIAKDHDWRAGKELVNYIILVDGQKFGNRITFVVRLQLRKSNQNESKTAEYIVATEPILTVSRNDDDDAGRK